MLHRIRLRKVTPQAPLADIFVREADWRKDDQLPIEHDDRYAQCWNTNFGPNPFEYNPPGYSQTAEDIVHLRITVPENNHPTSRKTSQHSGGGEPSGTDHFT